MANTGQMGEPTRWNLVTGPGKQVLFKNVSRVRYLVQNQGTGNIKINKRQSKNYSDDEGFIVQGGNPVGSTWVDDPMCPHTGDVYITTDTDNTLVTVAEWISPSA